MRLWGSLSLTVMLAFGGPANAQESSCLTVKKISASHRAVQQGGDIELRVKLATVDCSIPIAVQTSTNTTDLSLQPPEGFEASQPVIEIDGFESEPVNGSTWMGHAVTASVRLHAFREASVGEHTIPATLTYTAQDATGNIVSHSLALSIPVKVTPPPKPGFWDEHAQARKTLVTTGEVLLLIIALPVFIVGSILGFYQDC